jgi:hypothetical protein
MIKQEMIFKFWRKRYKTKKEIIFKQKKNTKKSHQKYQAKVKILKQALKTIIYGRLPT